MATHGEQPPPWRRCPELAVIHRRSSIPPTGSSYSLRFLVQNERQGKAKLTRAWISSREAVRGADVVVRRRGRRYAHRGGCCSCRGRGRKGRWSSWLQGEATASTRGGEFDRILRTRPPRALLGRDSGDSAPGKHAESTGTECVGSLRPEKGVGGTVASGSPAQRRSTYWVKLLASISGPKRKAREGEAHRGLDFT